MRTCLSLILFMGLFFDARAELETVEGLTYATYGSRELQLDLFKPKDQTAPLPAIVCIHGGGWRKGDRKSFGKGARYLAEHNYVVVSIDYRLSGEAPFPAQIHDCKAAIRWLRANAALYGIDPQRIGAIGHSAGGQLAALLATSSGNKALEGEGGNPAFASAIQAAVPMGAQTDLETDRIRSMTAESNAEIWHAYLGGSLDENKEMYQLASPRRYIDKTDPPMMFITGEHDNLDTHAAPIREDMRRLEIPYGLLIIPGAPHMFLSDKHWFEMGFSTAISFFDLYLK